MSDQKIRDAIKFECDRQQIDEDRQEMLYNACMDVMHTSGSLTADYLCRLAETIEPDNKGQYRTISVRFSHVLGRETSSLIPHMMGAWLEWFNETVKDLEMCRANFKACDEVIKEFFDIYPFSHGNVRIAWLLRVWMLDQWDHPQPLPDYFFVN